MENAKKSEPENMSCSGLCAKVREAVQRAGMSNIELSRRSGLSYRVIHSIMHATTNPRMTTLARIAEALGVSLENLTGMQFSDAASARESGVSYGSTAPMSLKPGWQARFQRAVESKAVLIEGAVKEYNMPFREAIKPAVLAFEKEEAVT